MSESDSQKILGWIDSALELFRNNRETLTAQEISIRSMLAVVRNEVADHGNRAGRPPGFRKFGAEE